LTLGRKLVAGVLLAGLLPLVLGIAVVAWRADSEREQRAQVTAQQEARAGSAALTRLMREFRYQLLLAAGDSALRRWYLDPSDHRQVEDEIEKALVLLHDLQPGLVDEACFIDASGVELARAVGAQVAADRDLSPDESGAPFFEPTFGLPPGSVYQGTMYVSGDSGRWVIPTATAIEVDGEATALLHFEVSLQGIRAQLAETLGSGVRFRVVDDATGTVVLDGTDDAPIVDAEFAPIGAWGEGGAVATVPIEGLDDDLAAWRLETSVAPSSSFGKDELVPLAILCLLALIALWWWARRVATGIVRPLERSAWAAQGLADGDLTRRVRSERSDELGAMANELDVAGERIGVAMSGIAYSTDELSEASSELTRASVATASASASTAEAAAMATHEAASVSDGVSSAEAQAGELRAGADRIAAGASDALRVAGDAVSTMTEATEVMGQLAASSDEIGEVVQLIEAVAEQTHLLALNASIEAARAGAAGKGFAVVAEEVKALATETQTGAAQIRERITRIQADARASRDANAKVAATVEQIEQRQREITGEIEEQVRVVHAMQSVLGDAARGADAIVERLRSVSGAATESSAEADLVRSAAVQLEEMSQRLRDLIGRFRFEHVDEPSSTGEPGAEHHEPSPAMVGA
jgi:methyl-accepting chemotaxis protein